MMNASELYMSVLIVIIIKSPIVILNQEATYNIIVYSYYNEFPILQVNN